MKIDLSQIGNIEVMTDEEIGRKVRELAIQSITLYIADIDFLKQYFSQNNRAFLEMLMRNYKVGISQLKRAAFEILAEWQAADDCKHNTYKDAHKHLTAHLRIKLKNGNTQQPTTKQQRDSDFESYIRQSLSAIGDGKPIPNRLQSK